MNPAEPAGNLRVQIAIAIVERDGRLLIGLRRPGVALAGLWEFPGGKVEAGESADAAAVRECLEETGCKIRILGEYPPMRHDYEHDKVALRFFRAAWVAQQDPLPSRFRWVQPQELRNYEFPAANAALLAQLAAVTKG